MSGMTTEARPLRRDARLNRERLVAAATEVFGERGVHAPLEEIARRAGVSIGTLYNRFPHRADLVDAVFVDIVRSSVTEAERHLADPDPWRALTGQLTTMAEQQAANRGYTDVCAYALPKGSATERLKARGREVMLELVDRAQQAGVVRPDVTVEDLSLVVWSAVRATEPVRDSAPEAWRRHLTLLLDGLRPDGATPFDVPPLAPGMVSAAMRVD
jgi:AcrR family transcriptional regulator